MDATQNTNNWFLGRMRYIYSTKYRYNKLGINTRTFHFGGTTRFLTFYSAAGNPNTDETFDHLFLMCPITKVVHELLDEAVFRNRHVSPLDKKLNWLGCQKSDNNIIFFETFSSGSSIFYLERKIKKKQFLMPIMFWVNQFNC